jgi:N-acetylglucosamine kinase-like BadF-type ATPase
MAISAVLRASDREENPTLLKGLMSALGATTAEELIVRINANPPPDFASLFPVVLSAAQPPDAGDSIAHQVLDQAGRELAELAETVVRRVFAESDEVHVATHGGVFANSVQVKNSFVDRLRSLCPRASYESKTIDPALGALECARRGFRSRTTDSL